MSETTNTGSRDAFQAEFEALPLEEKFARLLKMEVATLGETFKRVEESSAEAFKNVGEVLGDFGRKVEAEFKKAACGTADKAAGAAEEPKAASNAPEGN